jgi:phosphatidylserine decarboxylase
MTIAGTATMGDSKFPLAVRQISGAIARRIVCPVKPGKTIKRGAIYGMIKFGSRTEIYLPVDKFELNVKIGDKVNGGSSVIATIVD